MWFSDWSFAAEESSNLLSIGNIINFAVSILSWIWILFATIAGKLLTNEWVAGEIFWLDSLLWQYRNMMKNIANFGLWFYFVYVIFKWLISKWNDAIEKNIKSILLRILVAWIWIQASWFLTKVAIDVSTITLAAAWSFPSQMISQNEKLQSGIENSVYDFFGQNVDSLKYWVALDMFPANSKAGNLVEKYFVPLNGSGVSKKEFFDLLMPNEENISWPLYYMWVSIMKTNEINSLKSVDENSIKGSILNLIIQWWTTIIYSIEMAVLCILALMRVLYLWMFTVLSPITVLILCIEKSWNKNLWNKWLLSSLTKHINMKSFFINVFKPTIIVLGIWLAMMFTTLMNDVINWNKLSDEIDIWWVKIRTVPDTDSNMSNDKEYKTTIESDFWKFSISHLAKWLLDFILSIITVILVYMVIKMAVKMGDWKDFVSQKLGKIQDTVWNAITSLPVMPVAWYNSETWEKETHYISARSVFGENNNLFTRKINYYQKKVGEEYSKQTQAIRSLFGDETGYLTTNEITSIENAWGGMSWLDILKAKKSKISSIRDENWKWMTLNPQTSSNNGFWIQEFSAWLDLMKDKQMTWTDNNGTWNEMINRWNNKGNKDAHTLQEKSEKLQAMFGAVNNSAKAYAQYFFDSDDVRYGITSWNDLKNADISKKKSGKKSE